MIRLHLNGAAAVVIFPKDEVEGECESAMRISPRVSTDAGTSDHQKRWSGAESAPNPAKECKSGSGGMEFSIPAECLNVRAPDGDFRPSWSRPAV